MYKGLEIKWLNAAKTCGITPSGKCFAKHINHNGNDFPMFIGLVVDQKFEPRNDNQFAEGRDWDAAYEPKRQRMIACLESHGIFD